MKAVPAALFASTLLAMSSVSANAEPRVVASIKPVHSLVAAVMDGVGTPDLLVEGAASPHTYALRPSQARILENADLVFWIGHELEAFLEKPLETIAKKATSVELIDAHDLVKHPFREGGAFEAHEHDDHDDHGHDKVAEKHDDHDDHDHDKAAEKQDDHDHDKAAEKHDDHDHDHDKAAETHDDHDHGSFDAHVWLDPANAKVMIEEIAVALVGADPANAPKYKANAYKAISELDQLTAEISAAVAPAKGKGFIVFHDAYQYFEKRFGVAASGSITVSPEVMPGAARISEIREKVKQLGAVCVFSEPQFEPKLVAVVVEGTEARTGVLDPLGADLDAGPDHYSELIRNMAAAMRNCLAGTG